MASKAYMPVVHVNDGDVALGGRRRWCWPFFKQTKYLLQLIAINEIEIYFCYIHTPLVVLLLLSRAFYQRLIVVFECFCCCLTPQRAVRQLEAARRRHPAQVEKRA